MTRARPHALFASAVWMRVVWLSADDMLGVAREEFVKSIKQFLKVESELYPVFIITNPKSE